MIRKHTFSVLNSKGFSLIEALLSMAFMSISLLAIAHLLSSITLFNRNARQATSATTLAQDKLEILQSRPWNTLVGGTDTETLDEDGNSGGPYSRTTVIDDASYPALKTIAVTVSWQRPGGSTRSVTLRSSAAK